MNSVRDLRLDIRDLACERGGRIVFSDLGLTAGAGELVAIIGPNGAGKSSLLRVIAGLVPKSAGSIILSGGDSDKTITEQVHYCGHSDALKSALTVRENLGFWRSFYGAPRLDVDDALDRFGIEHLADLPTAYLSAGQKRRLSLCRLLVAWRPVWLLDEPTSALDTTTQARLTGIMQAHREDGGLILAATHGDLGPTPSQTFIIGAQ